MFTKVIPYIDYNGHERNEEFQFNFTKAEILDLDLRTPGGLKGFYERIIQTEDGQQLADQFKFLIQESYGVKSLDGRRFMKSPEILKNFTETPAYEKLYLELATNSDSASAFVNGIMPKEMVDAALAEKEAEAKKAAANIQPAPVAAMTQPQPSQNVVPMPQQPVDPVLPREVAPVVMNPITPQA